MFSLNDTRPHYVDCPTAAHDHGVDCHPSCPTCGGAEMTAGEPVETFTGELVSEPSALEQLAEAALDGRFSMVQRTRRNGDVVTTFVVEDPTVDEDQ